mgnify:CR=1 FL=1
MCQIKYISPVPVVVTVLTGIGFGVLISWLGWIAPGQRRSPKWPARRVSHLLCVLTAILFVSCGESNRHENIRVPDVSAIEGYMESEGRSLWYRVVNPHSSGIPLLIQAGGPAPSYYLEPLEILASDRPVVFYDQFGTGRSSKPEGTFEWSVQLYLDDLNALRAALGLRRVHLLGHSWGTMLLAAYMETAPEGIESLILVSPSVSAARWLEDAGKLRAALPPGTDAILREHESRAAFDEPAYQDAAMVFLKRHFCRLDTWPAVLMKTIEEMGPAYEAMWAPNEFVATGVLRDFDKTGVLGTITVPTLFIGGEYDEAPPETIRWHADMVPDSQVTIIPGASHMPMLENPTLFNERVRAFLRSTEQSQPEEAIHYYLLKQQYDLYNEAPKLNNKVPDTQGYVLKAGEGEALGPTRLIKASPRSGTQGGIVVLDQLPPGFTTGFHAHTNADEFFYVIAGTGTASIGEEDIPIGAGDFVFVPTGGTHKMSVAETGPMELLYFLDEPGLDDFFRAAHALYFSQFKTMTLEECNAIGEKYGMVCITER